MAWLYFFSKFENMVIMMRNLAMHIFLQKKREKDKKPKKKKHVFVVHIRRYRDQEVLG